MGIVSRTNIQRFLAIILFLNAGLAVYSFTIAADKASFAVASIDFVLFTLVSVFLWATAKMSANEVQEFLIKKLGGGKITDEKIIRERRRIFAIIPGSIGVILLMIGVAIKLGFLNITSESPTQKDSVSLCIITFGLVSLLFVAIWRKTPSVYQKP